MAATDRTLDLKIISAKGLNKVNLVGKMDVYALVYISGTGNQDQKHKTTVDKDGDSNPTWNFPITFKIDESAALQNRLTLVVKIKAEAMFGDKDLGEVHVPVKELLEGDSVGGKPVQFVTYQVRRSSGKPKGELTFSYKFSAKSSSTVTAGVGHSGNVDEPVTAYPAGNRPNQPEEVVTVVTPNSDLIGNRLDEPVTAYPSAVASGSGSGFGSLYPPVYPPPFAAAPGAYPPPPSTTAAAVAAVASSTAPAGYPTPAAASSASGFYPPPPPPPTASESASMSTPPAGYPTAAPAAGGAYYPPAPAGYPQPKAAYAYPQQPAYGGYPPPALPPDYGGCPYPYPPQAGYYVYPPVQQPQPPKDTRGLGFGAGLLGGAMGGLLIGDVVSDGASGGGYGGGY